MYKSNELYCTYELYNNDEIKRILKEYKNELDKKVPKYLNSLRRKKKLNLTIRKKKLNVINRKNMLIEEKINEI